MIISSASLMWSKSPLLLGTVAVAIFIKERFEKFVKRFEFKLQRYIGLDKHQWKGWYEMHSIRTALSNFEDMRINAKELGILKDAKRTTLNAEADQVRLDLIPSVMRPIYLFLSDVPTVVGAYVGGTLAQGGSLSAADLAGFTVAIATLLDGIKKCYKTLKNLIKLEDERFNHGFQIMDLLEMKPTMGLEKGWKPLSILVEEEKDTEEEEEEEEGKEGDGEEKNNMNKPEGIQSTTLSTTNPNLTIPVSSKNLENLDSNNCLKGDIVFNNVSFKYKGMQSNMLKNISFTIKEGSFVGICGERGAGKSTIYKLLMRLYDPTEGSITIGGHLLSYYNPVWLRSQIGISVSSKFEKFRSFFLFYWLPTNIFSYFYIFKMIHHFFKRYKIQQYFDINH